MKILKKKQKSPIEKKKSILPGAILAGLIAAVIIYAVMLNAEKNLLTDFEKGTVYTAVKEIPKGQLITEKNRGEYFKLQELDVKLIPKTAVRTPEEISGLVPKYDIEQNTLLTIGMFDDLNEITKNMENPVIAGFKAEDLYQVAGGVLRSGDRIHVYKVEEQGENLGNASLVWEDVYIADVFDSAGNRIGNDDTVTAAQRVNVYLDKDDVELFYSELAKGSLRTAKVLD